jgi:succinate dehydrogenase hydrophobic anchor subunit
VVLGSAGQLVVLAGKCQHQAAGNRQRSSRRCSSNEWMYHRICGRWLLMRLLWHAADQLGALTYHRLYGLLMQTWTTMMMMTMMLAYPCSAV